MLSDSDKCKCGKTFGPWRPYRVEECYDTEVRDCDNCGNGQMRTRVMPGKFLDAINALKPSKPPGDSDGE